MNSLFSLAQVLTLDHEKAVHLVEKTYLRALSGPALSQINIEDRRYLLQLLIEIHQQSDTPRHLFAQSGDTAVPAPKTVSDSVKIKMLENVLNRSLPLAFATLDRRDRALLVLCEIEQLSIADASLILSSDSESVTTRLNEAKANLIDKLLKGASPIEAKLIKEIPPREWLPSILQKSLKTSYPDAPSTLEPRIRSSFSNAPDRSPVASNYSVSSVYPPSARAGRSRFTQRLLGIILILAAGLAGYIGSTLLERKPNSNLISISAQQARRARAILTTSEPREAQEFITTHLNWRLSLPDISGSTIQGVGISEIIPGVRVPVFLYESEENRRAPITLYAYTYALLDQYKDQIELDAATLTAIAEDDHIDQYELRSGDNAFVWRDSDDIFIAVTSQVELQDRIIF